MKQEEWSYAIQGDLAKVKKALDEGLDVNFADAYSTTALHWAVQYGNLDVVGYLLEHGANPNLHNRAGNTPLMLAARSGERNCLEIVRCLLAAGADVQAKDTSGGTAIDNARNKPEVLELLQYSIRAKQSNTTTVSNKWWQFWR